jgi:hypothetical protein
MSGLEVTKQWTWRIIANVFFFGPVEEYVWCNDGGKLICLAYNQWPTMRYWKENVTQIDFPGEYDLQGYGIECRRAAWCLHYVINVYGKRIALVQDPAVVAEEDNDRVDVWYCTSQECMKAIEEMELEGECVLLSASDE